MTELVLVIRQNFPYHVFILATANVALATVLSNFSQCQFVNILSHQNFALYGTYKDKCASPSIRLILLLFHQLE